MSTIAGPSGEPPRPPRGGPPKKEPESAVERRAKARAVAAKQGSKVVVAHPGYYPGFFQEWPFRGQDCPHTPHPLREDYLWPCEVQGIRHDFEPGMVPCTPPLSDHAYICDNWLSHGHVQGELFEFRRDGSGHAHQCQRCGKIVCDFCREIEHLRSQQ